jgi:hypothetical protein
MPTMHNGIAVPSRSVEHMKDLAPLARPVVCVCVCVCVIGFKLSSLSSRLSALSTSLRMSPAYPHRLHSHCRSQPPQRLKFSSLTLAESQHSKGKTLASANEQTAQPGRVTAISPYSPQAASLASVQAEPLEQLSQGG